MLVSQSKAQFIENDQNYKVKIQQKLSQQSPLQNCYLSLQSIVWDTLVFLLFTWSPHNSLCPRLPQSATFITQIGNGL